MPEPAVRRFLHTMVRVSDLNQSLHFYCNLLGLREVRRKHSHQGRFTLVFLQAPEGDGQIELTYNWTRDGKEPEAYSHRSNMGHLAYETDDIYGLCQKLMDHGATIHRPPRDGYMAFVKSPDGISIEILQSGDPKPPQEPWASMKSQGTW